MTAWNERWFATRGERARQETVAFTTATTAGEPAAGNHNLNVRLVSLSLAHIVTAVRSATGRGIDPNVLARRTCRHGHVGRQREARSVC